MTWRTLWIFSATCALWSIAFSVFLDEACLSARGRLECAVLEVAVENARKSQADGWMDYYFQERERRREN